ncbi:MAG: hypothetical protein SNJ62_01205, partial [Chloracidobacterium sp.]
MFSRRSQRWWLWIGLCLFGWGWSATSVLAWNQAGHATVAAIAYAHLTPRARARVDAILKQHPEYA